jgi:hypothetical protein
MGHPHQKMPLKYLEETVRRYNELAAKGVDEDNDSYASTPRALMNWPTSRAFY